MEKEDVPLIQDNQVREHFRKSDIHKFMRPDGIHPQVLKKFSIIPDKSWLLKEVSEDWRKTNSTHIFRKRKIKDSGNYGINQPHLNYWESDRDRILEYFFKR